MEAKLIKVENTFYLKQGGTILGTSSYPNLSASIRYSLSLENCQAIERDNPTEEYILEVNGDGWDDHSYKGKRKKTEWDVEIVMEDIIHLKNRRGGLANMGKPKLDADECLILKRKL